jgi:hypothetical protein
MKIVIPKKDSYFRRTIKKGSGIVMRTDPNFPIPVIYYEGNLYGASNLESFDERIVCAAGRAHKRYPTVARCGVLDVDEFEIIGECYPENNYFIQKFNDRRTNNIITEWLS